MADNEKSNKLSNTQIASKSSLVAAVITIPTLVSFFSIWQIFDNLIYGAIGGLIVNFIALGFSFTIVKKFLVKKQNKDTELN